MKRFFYFIVMTTTFLRSFGSEYSVSEVIELTNDISARTNLRTDENDKPCAVLRFNIPSVDNIKFDGVVGDIAMLPGEYTMFLKEGSPSLSYTINGEKSEVVFSDYGLSIEGKKSYRVILKNKNQITHPSSTSALISANQDGIIVLVDGVPVGETPVSIESINPGPHIISVPYQKGYTMEDRKVTIEANKRNDINLSLKESVLEPVEIEIAHTGGDTAGDYERWGISVISENGKEGIVDYTGATIVPCEFDKVDLEYLLDGCYSVWVPDNNPSNNTSAVRHYLNGIYAPGQGLLVPCEYEFVRAPYKDENIIEAKKDGKWALMNGQGKILTPFIFEKIDCNDGVAILSRGKYCDDLFDYSNNKMIIPATKRYEFFPFNEGYALFEDHYHGYPSRDCKVQGIVDRNGNEMILPYGYEICETFYGETKIKGGLFPVMDIKTKKVGYMNPQLQLVIPAIYDSVDKSMDFENGVALVYLDNIAYVIDRQGTRILDNKTDNLRKFSFNVRTNLIEVSDNDSQGLYDLKGTAIIPLGQYRYISSFNDGKDKYFVGVAKSGEREILDSNLNLLFSLPEDVILRDYDKGMFYYEVKGSDNRDLYSGELKPYGYLNPKGEIIATGLHSIESYYDAIISDYRLSEGLGIINIGDLYGYVNNKGDLVVPMIYTAITPFTEGVCYARDKEGKWKKIYRKDI